MSLSQAFAMIWGTDLGHTCGITCSYQPFRACQCFFLRFLISFTDTLCNLNINCICSRHCPCVCRPDVQWTHEDASEMMFDDLVEQNGIQIAQDDINFIKDLIKGEVRHSNEK